MAFVVDCAPRRRRADGSSLSTPPMGFREPIRRSTLADANEGRDWRIYAEFAQRLIGQARRLLHASKLRWKSPAVPPHPD